MVLMAGQWGHNDWIKSVAEGRVTCSCDAEVYGKVDCGLHIKGGGRWKLVAAISYRIAGLFLSVNRLAMRHVGGYLDKGCGEEMIKQLDTTVERLWLTRLRILGEEEE